MIVTFQEMSNLIHSNQLNKASKILNKTKIHNSYWHYFSSVIALKKCWFDTAKKHIEIARKLKPNFEPFENFYAKLMSRSSRYSNDYHHSSRYRRRGCDCCDCDCCPNISCCDLICLDSICECMGGDLIECI
ncbi:hypothetical protein AN640_04760 [Candidatus Epulonipiscium fishelsonii]|uniref:Uncharacterized protein n=1 Tax=Candidatus Epulonipiscium fishelsonii TaxID=77094 RepID=A0ACC8XIF6_9FIRM|nr:hypothetical protein AN640_04760 [Epulopiscium sp. SCG-D08WGA-EpuloA1]